ncbi:YoaK family protein [Mucilaginibacter angelicae]|uniref:YoaK family protein n=1 Tax=Mucilaginibacter angelicae TaxID=869718 RepID=A0ABV6KZN3_9SPHI
MEDFNEAYKMRVGTIILTFAAGFCDALTFVTANALFSAHITGNFILFAYEVAVTHHLTAWGKLISLPVFMLSVVLSGVLVKRIKNKYNLLVIEGVILIIASLINFFGRPFLGDGSPALYFSYCISMVIVIAMALQNVFGRSYTKDTFGTTTMMTGNLISASLLISGYFLRKNWEKAELISLRRLLVTMAGFLFGCICGALLGKEIGLTAAVIPGITLLLFFCGTTELL